jgi:hypothetical protein
MTTETKAEYLVADAIRIVSLRVMKELQRGERAAMIDTNDLIEILLTIADELEQN